MSVSKFEVKSHDQADEKVHTDSCQSSHVGYAVAGQLPATTPGSKATSRSSASRS